MTNCVMSKYNKKERTNLEAIYNMLIKDDAWLSILKGLGITIKISLP